MRDSKEYVVLDAVVPQAVTSSTDATPIVVTKASHGYSDGDLVMINGHTTNLAANGIYRVANKTTNTFELTDRYTGADIAGTGAGAGADGVVMLAPKILLVEDFRNAVFSVETSGSASFTLKPAGSLGVPNADATPLAHGDTPNFGATQSASNPYSFIQIINLDTAAAVNGATGVTSAGTDLHNTYEVNTNGLKYLTFVLTAWTAGTLTVKAQLYTNQ